MSSRTNYIPANGIVPLQLVRSLAPRLDEMTPENSGDIARRMSDGTTRFSKRENSIPIALHAHDHPADGGFVEAAVEFAYA
jgi:hypothetical protein